jgi:hypothetical protein
MIVLYNSWKQHYHLKFARFTLCCVSIPKVILTASNSATAWQQKHEGKKWCCTFHEIYSIPKLLGVCTASTPFYSFTPSGLLWPKFLLCICKWHYNTVTHHLSCSVTSNWGRLSHSHLTRCSAVLLRRGKNGVGAHAAQCKKPPWPKGLKAP